MSLNVNRSDDAFYRYKMPKIMTKIEGKGNGIKTVIVNMSDIAKALNRKASYPTKFFGVECGAQTQMDDKNDRYIVNGVHESAKLQELMYSFIQKYVLCPSCGNPETVLRVKSKSAGIVGYRCKACGHQGEVNSQHRLTQYIVKNPPEPDVETEVNDENADGEAGNAEDGDNGGEDDDGQSGFLDVPEARDVDEASLQWSADTSDLAMAERMQELTGAAQRLTLITDEQEESFIRTEGERGDRLLALVKATKKKTGEGKPLLDDDVRFLRESKEKLRIREGGVLCFVEGLWDNPNNLLSDIALYRPLMYAITRSSKAQRYLLGGIELLISANRDKLLQSTPKILHALYDNDLLDESIIDAWFKKGPNKRYVDRKLSAQILQKAKAFIDWLANADEESSDEEAQPAVGNHLESKTSEPLTSTDGKAAAALDEGDESDVDIDNL